MADLLAWRSRAAYPIAPVRLAFDSDEDEWDEEEDWDEDEDWDEEEWDEEEEEWDEDEEWDEEEDWDEEEGELRSFREDWT